MVPSFLYDRTKSALPRTPLPSNPGWSPVSSKGMLKKTGVNDLFDDVDEIFSDFSL